MAPERDHPTEIDQGDLDGLAAALFAEDSATLLVSPRLLRRVVKRHRRVPGLGLDVPHGFAYSLSREALLLCVDEADLGHAAEDLAAHVILVPRPLPHEHDDAGALLVRMWRARFHAGVHGAIEGRVSAAVVRARFRAIGRTEMEEAREVLREERHLLPPYDPPSTYAEFAATYLELRAFAPDAVARTFPAIRDVAAVDAVLALDVDTAALVERSRPVVKLGSHEPLEAKVANGARAALGRGIHDDTHASAVHAAVVVAEGGAAVDAAAIATEAELRALVARAAAKSRWSVEARFLYDLRRAEEDRVRASFVIDGLEWARTLGRRSLRRELPLLRELRPLRRLRAAQKKVPRLALDDEARARVGHAVDAWTKIAEARLEATLRPRIDAALDEAGLVAASLPERVARKKLAMELVDTVVERGFLSIGQLRDAFSRSDLKLPNLTAHDALAGDALLRADALLSESLEGVYRRGEIYLRGLQRASALFFGTRVGRFLTLYLILPFGAAFVALGGLQHVVGPLMEYVLHLPEPELFTPTSFLVVSAWIFGLVHSAPVRRATLFVFRAIFLTLKGVFVVVPRWIATRPFVTRILASRPTLFAGRFLLKPFVLLALVWPFVRHLALPPLVALPLGVVAFVATGLFLGSKAGVRAEDAVVDFFVEQWRMIQKHVLPGLLALFVDVFRRLLDALERAIYAVDEQLRLHRGDGAISLAVKVLFGTAWFFVRYVLRIYVNLLIEPQINPIKHFPVVTVAAKLILPFHRRLSRALADFLAHAIRRGVARAIASPTIILSPGFFGFLVWEFKENFKLFAQNRAAALEPVAIGHHGESLSAYLVPGFHAGTIPRAWAKLRRAAKREKKSDKADAIRHDLVHIEETIARFVDRGLIALLDASPRWTFGPLSVSSIEIASNRVRVGVAIECGAPLVLDFEEQGGWLVANVSAVGFLDALDRESRATFELALAGLYKSAGVDLVREQIAACVSRAPFDIAGEGLVVWPEGEGKGEIVYDLASAKRGRPLGMNARGLRGESRVTRPSLSPEEMFFRDQPVLWTAWVAAWDAATAPRVLTGPSLLPPSAAH